MPDGYTELGSIPVRELRHDCRSLLPNTSHGYTSDYAPGMVLQCDFCGTAWVTVPGFRLGGTSSKSGDLYCQWSRVSWWTRWKLRRQQAQVDLARR